MNETHKQRSSRDIAELLVVRLKSQRFAQVEEYNRFEYVSAGLTKVTVRRENGNDVVIPMARLVIGIDAVRKDPTVYERGPGSLREFGITHINSPIWSILHLLPLEELLA